MVGTGPALGIHGPGTARPGEAGQPDDPRIAAQYWLAGFLEAYARLERDMAIFKMALRELEADLEADRLTPRNAKTDNLRSYMQMLVNTKEMKLAELKKEQDALVKSALERWRDFSACLDDKVREVGSMPGVAWPVPSSIM